MEPLKIDPRNPGQVFACYGLFELAELKAPGGVGSFREKEPYVWLFELETPISLTDCIKVLQNMKIRQIEEDDFRKNRYAQWDINWEKEGPVLLETEWGNIHLNWWRTPTFQEKTGFKFWAGRVSPIKLLTDLKNNLHLNPEEPFQPVGLTTCFGFDANFTWSRRDVGFSLDHLKFAGKRTRVFLSPLAEILSVIALQTFKPKLRKNEIEYYLWKIKLPLLVARIACSGCISSCVGWKSRIVDRGGGRYKALYWATKL